VLRLTAPRWLCHNVATRVRDEFKIEAAHAHAGHASQSMTGHYASNMDGLAVMVAVKSGRERRVGTVQREACKWGVYI
jgi:hypothetical protein